MKTLFCFYISLFLSLSFFAQEVQRPDTAQLFYRHFTVQDGLPSNEAYFGYQDKTGYVWICTDNGVSRFDGVQFRNYNSAEGLRSNIIFGCKEDPKGKLWLYSFAGELYCYQPLTDRFESPGFNDSLTRILGGRVIQNLVFEKDTIYVISAGAYVKLVLRPNNQTTFNLVENEAQTLTAKVLSNGEVVVINSTEENVTRFNFELTTPGSTPQVIRNIPIYGLVQPQLSALKSGTQLYVVFGENLLAYDLKTGAHTMEVLPFSHIPALKESSVGILSGSYGKGLWTMVKGPQGFVYRQLIKSKNISGSFEDTQGGIWACSQTDGVYFVPNRTALSFPVNDGEPSRRVTAMFTLGQEAYYLTYSGALYKITAGTQPMQTRLIEPGQYTMTDMKLMNGNEILMFAGRHMKYTISSGKMDNIGPVEICERGTTLQRSAVSNRRDKLILKTCGTGWPEERVIFNNWCYGRVFTEIQGRNGNMWLGTVNDLVYVDTLRRVVTEVGKKNGLRKFSVKQILALNGDSVLTASNQGIFLVVGDQIRKRITADDGLSSNNVQTLFLFDGELWAGTSRGIDRIKNFRTSGEPIIISVTGLSGISKRPVTHLGAIGNYIVAGTDEGVHLFERTLLFKDPVSVAALVTDVTVNGLQRIITPGKEIELGFKENSLDIHFNALNHRNALFNSYRYRLKNSDAAKWAYTSQNHVLFPLLSPGNYEFQLQAMNPDGSWSPVISGFSLTIAKPFWQTWWFIVLLVIVAAVCTYAFILFRIKQMQKVGDLTNRLSEVKMQALGMQFNPYFILNAINYLSSQIAKNDSKTTVEVLGKFAKLTRMVFKNSQNAIIPLEEELKALNLFVELETARLGKQFEYVIDVDTINVSECKMPALLLQPIVDNAISHGIASLDTGGKLKLIFMRIGDTLQIEIIDNGIGRQKALQLKTGSGRRRRSFDSIKERLLLLRTKYSSYTHMEISDAFEDQENCGTKVLLILPWLSDSEVRGKDNVLKHFIMDDQSAYN